MMKLFKKGGIFKEVVDKRELVYDFRRRSTPLFENYRAVSYTTPKSYNLDTMKSDVLHKVNTLVSANAIDSGNVDCLVETILGSVRSTILFLDNQALEHEDFYERQAGNLKAHCKDIARMIEFCDTKEKMLMEEHEHTKALWDTYHGKKGGNNHEEQ